MRSGKIMAAMLAAALVTTTAASAAEVSTETGYDGFFTVGGSKGTYELTDDQFEALSDFCNEVYSCDQIFRAPLEIVDENSSFNIADSESLKIDQIYDGVTFDLVDITKDEAGNVSYNTIYSLNNVYPVATFKPIWSSYTYCSTIGCGVDDSTYLFPTLNVSDLISVYDSHCEFLANEFDEDIQTFDEVDMIFLTFHYNDEFGEDGLVVNPWEYDEEKGDYVARENSHPRYYTAWVLTEQGAAILSESGTSADSADNTEDNAEPAADYTVDVTEALSADDFADVLAENANADVVFKSENGVSIRFAKGTMSEVDGVDAYDFTSKISTDLDSSVSDKLTKDNFVLSIDYAYSGKLPAKAEITIPVGTEYAGKTLYYSRILENGVKLTDSAVVDKNGNITVTQDRCSDYILTTENVAPAAENTDNTDKKGSPDTGIEFNAIAAIAVLGVAAAVLSRKRK